MTIAQLEDYLFKPYSELEKNPELEEEFNKVDINQLTEEEGLNWLKIMQKRSLWDEYFIGYDLGMGNIQKDLETIRKYRNKVAHNKNFSKEDFDYCRKILNEFNSTLSYAINNIEERDFAKTDWNVLYKSVTSMISRMMGMISEEIQESLNELSKSMTGSITEMAKSVNNSLDQLFPASTQNVLRQMQEKNDEIVKQLGQSCLKLAQQSIPKLSENSDGGETDKESEEE